MRGATPYREALGFESPFPKSPEEAAWAHKQQMAALYGLAAAHGPPCHLYFPLAGAAATSRSSLTTPGTNGSSRSTPSPANVLAGTESPRLETMV